MLLDGKVIAAEIQEEIFEQVANLQGRKPALAVILVGDDPASTIYVQNKQQACQKTAIQSHLLHFPSTLSEKELIKEIETLNRDSNIDGILVQLPLPSSINTENILLAIDPSKDVDGFHPINMGKLLLGLTDGFIPCTPLGIKVLLEKYAIELEGKHVVIVGRSNTVGKPLAALLMQKEKGANATVTIAHSYTKNLKEICLTADVIIAAIGRPHTITEEMVKKGATIVDVGITRIQDPSSKKGTRLVGDVDFDRLKDKCSYITPVPGGVGPLTVAMLLSNTFKSYHEHFYAGMA